MISTKSSLFSPFMSPLHLYFSLFSISNDTTLLCHRFSNIFHHNQSSLDYRCVSSRVYSMLLPAHHFHSIIFTNNKIFNYQKDSVMHNKMVVIYKTLLCVHQPK